MQLELKQAVEEDPLTSPHLEENMYKAISDGLKRIPVSVLNPTFLKAVKLNAPSALESEERSQNEIDRSEQRNT